MGLRVLMMGTGDFAVPALETLYQSGHDVVGLVTQPDRFGPGNKPVPVSRMKQTALAHETPVFQPDNVNLPESLNRLREFQADLFVVAAYGQILSRELLEIPPRGSVNLHASLLPKYRGASPVAYAIWKGESESGVSLIRILPALDAGPILGVVKTPIEPADTAGTLEDRLAALAGPLLLEGLAAIEQGRETGITQVAELVTRAPKLRKEQGVIDWSRRAEEIDWHVRAMQPWPGARTVFQIDGNIQVRVQVRPVRVIPECDDPASPGTILVAKRELVVRAGSGAIQILTLQPDGKRQMQGEDFLRGYPIRAGDRLQ